MLATSKQKEDVISSLEARTFVMLVILTLQSRLSDENIRLSFKL